ncbi:response regulator [Leptospira langatensis]|uniref:Response regulator n=1 Tax=Leptospira langatensis TaxID=2484983 RepID=A0A5F1ZWU4_9LEPT|nr:response regulator [Leptospira langatensis]TGJ98420.1 response regulator [Leptospira langatensis]TGL43335.1 response regulator [Leptospira langatensis]
MKNTRILIVEDEGLVAQDLKQRLIRMGYPEPSIASTGEVAVKQAVSLQPDLILMDIILENGYLDGVDAARRIRKFLDVPIIYLTASSDAQTIQRAKLTEPNAYILKPFQTRELQIIIELILYKYQIDHELMEEDRIISDELRNLEEGIIASNSLGNISFMNPAAERMTGWMEEDALGKPLEEVLKVKKMAEEADFQLEEVSETNQKVPSHGLLVSKNGLTTEVLTVTKTLPEIQEVDVDHILVIRDLVKR